MLESLDTIPWHMLEHAYGEAGDIPRLLRDLTSVDEEVRQNARTTLGFTVYHQGTVYSSTAYVMPFFCELLQATHQEEEQLWYLTFFIDIARDASFLDFHITLDRQRPAQIGEAPDLLIQEIAWMRAAQEAVSAGYSTYMRLFQEKDAKLRTYAALTLGLCRYHAEQVIPAILEQLTLEQEQTVRITLLLSLGQLMPWNERAHNLFTQILNDSSRSVESIAAAIACAFSAREATPPEVVHALLKSYEQPSWVEEAFRATPYAEYDLHVCLSQAFRAIGLTLAPLVIPTLLFALKRSDYYSALILVDHALYFSLEGKVITDEMIASDLSRMQREVLWALVAYEDLWEFQEMMFTMGKYFRPLPIWRAWTRSRNEIFAFLADTEQGSMRLAEFIQQASTMGLSPRRAMELLGIEDLNELDYQEALERLRHHLREGEQAE